MTTMLIPERDSVLNTQYNAVRNDVLTHTHNGLTGGTKVKFSSLAWDDDLAPDGLNNTLEEIDAHIGSTDNHGVATGVGLIGSPTTGLMIQYGYVSLSVAASETKTAVVVFEKPYTSTPQIIISQYATLTPASYISAEINSVALDRFTAVCSVAWPNYVAGMSGFSWIAIGT